MNWIRTTWNGLRSRRKLLYIFIANFMIVVAVAAVLICCDDSGTRSNVVYEHDEDNKVGIWYHTSGAPLVVKPDGEYVE